MQKTHNCRPVFRWQQNNENHFLFCGEVFLAGLRWYGREFGYEYFRIEHAAFSDALVKEGDGRWNGQPFDLKGKTFVGITDMVEQLYIAVFDRLDFTMTHE